MKGNGSSYGFDEISRLGGQIETQAKASELEAVHESTQALALYLSTVQVEFTD